MKGKHPEKYEGYISTQLGEQASQGELENLAKKLVEIQN